MLVGTIVDDVLSMNWKIFLPFLFVVVLNQAYAQNVGSSKQKEDIYVFPNVIKSNCDSPKCGALFLSTDSAETEVLIYDRWGNKMHEGKTSGGMLWNTRDEAGKLCNSGTYFFVVKVFVNGRNYGFKGNVSVVR
jgi:hypothetical protein